MFSINTHYKDNNIKVDILSKNFPDTFTLKIFPDKPYINSLTIFIEGETNLIKFKNEILWEIERVLKEQRNV